MFRSIRVEPDPSYIPGIKTTASSTAPPLPEMSP